MEQRRGRYCCCCADMRVAGKRCGVTGRSWALGGKFHMDGIRGDGRRGLGGNVAGGLLKLQLMAVD
jgi:hypothetical protein